MSPGSAAGRGSLTVVGTGIRFGLQTTAEALGAIRRAGKVLHLLGDPAAEAWIRRVNPSSQSLYPLYREGRPREEAYRAMVEEVLSWVRRGLDTCLAVYGHPGVFVAPSHEAIRLAAEEGYPARMLPGVSAEDCLFADLGVDPGDRGCQSFEATDFLLRGRRLDTTVPLVLWQVSVIGVLHAVLEPSPEGLAVLAERLEGLYGLDHPVVLYEAPNLPTAAPVIHRLAVRNLPGAALAGMSTLYVPPAADPPTDPEMASRLGIAEGTTAAGPHPGRRTAGARSV